MQRTHSALGLALVVSMAAIPPAMANDFFGEVTTQAPETTRSGDALRHQAWIQHKTAYGLRDPEPGFSRDQADFTQFETQAFARLNSRWQDWAWQISGTLAHDWLPDATDSAIWSGYEFTDEQEKARRWQADLGDTFVSRQFDDFWLQAGYQTLAWGEAETLTVTDVLARRDERWPGQADLEQLRLPVPAIQLSWQNQLEGVVLLNTQTSRLAAAGDDFDSWVGLRASDPDIVTQDPKNPIGWALRWKQRWPGTDAQLVLADVNSFQPTPVALDVAIMNGQAVPSRLELQQARQRVVGVAVQASRGSWLWRTEQALHAGVPLRPENLAEDWRVHNQWRGMIGFDYSGVSNLLATAELAVTHTLDQHEAVAGEPWQFAQSLRLQYSLLNDRLTLTGQGVLLGVDQGNLMRAMSEWDVSDLINVGLTAVSYGADEADQMLYPYRNNDAVILNVRLNL